GLEDHGFAGQFGAAGFVGRGGHIHVFEVGARSLVGRRAAVLHEVAVGTEVAQRIDENSLGDRGGRGGFGGEGDGELLLVLGRGGIGEAASSGDKRVGAFGGVTELDG